MSLLEFLSLKTSSNPLDQPSKPENFSEAIDEFFNFCERQLPTLFDTDYLTTCFDISQNEETAVLGGKLGNIVIYEMKNKRSIKDEEITKVSIDSIYLASEDTQIVISTSNYEIYFLDFSTLVMLHHVQLSASPMCIKIGGNKSVLYCSN